MSTFKVGDIVRATRSFTDEEFPNQGWMEDMEKLIGEQLTVTEVTDKDLYAHKNGSQGWWWPLEVLELVVEKFEFKVGDKVCVVKRVESEKGWSNVWTEDMDDYIGKTLTISSVYSQGIYFVGCPFDFPASSLEFVESAKAADEIVSRAVASVVEPLCAEPFPAADTGSAATSKHYNSKLIQPIEICQMTLTPEEFQGAMKFNIMKYTQRAGSKDGEGSEKDWNKALQYKMWLELAKQGVTINPREHIV